MNLKAIFRPICWITEWYRTIRCTAAVSGHDFRSDYFGQESAYKPLRCGVCGKISEGERGNNE